MKVYKVYGHISPSGKTYIGITCQRPYCRWGTGGKNYKDCPGIWHAIQKYGWDNIEHKILFDNLTRKEACEKEIELIAKYKKLKLSYNINEGGEGSRGHKLSDETKMKIRLSKLGRPGHKPSSETKRKLSENRIGIKNPNFGKPNPNRKKIYVFDNQYQLLYTYSNMTEASIKTGYSLAWFSILKEPILRDNLIFSKTKKISNCKHKISIKSDSKKIRRKSKSKIQSPIKPEIFDTIPTDNINDCELYIGQFDISGKLLSIYTSGRRLRKDIGISLGALTNHKDKDHFYYKGYWYKVCSFNPEMPISFDVPKCIKKSKDPKAMPVIQFCLNGTVLNQYSSCGAAAKHHNISASTFAKYADKPYFYLDGSWWLVIKKAKDNLSLS